MSDASENRKGSKGGFWNAIKNAVVEEVPGSPASTSQPPVAAPPAYRPDKPVVSANAVGADPEVRKILERDVQLAAHPAYSEFSSLTESMAAVLPDESIRFQAVLAALGSKGMTTQNILTDIEECFQALDKKSKDVELTATKERTDRIGGRETELQRVNDSIKALQVQVADLEGVKTKLINEITAETVQIEEAEQRFVATVTAYRTELMDRKNKILNLTKGK